MNERVGAADYGAVDLNLEITKELAQFISASRFQDLPADVVHAAKRGVLDWLGCALAGSRHATIAKLLPVLVELSGRAEAQVLGHPIRLGLIESAIANGQMGHVLDFDDTHMGGVVLHASSPILAALLAVCCSRPLDGRSLIAAYVGGFEAGVRAGQGAPGHHKGGWHLTGTLGSIAAGAAVGRALGLTPQSLTYALGIAATQAAGMQQNRGTMCKSFHAGKAAANGLLAGLLAEQGFDSSEEILEGKRGFCRIYSDIAAPERILDELGTRWEILRNGHKPYACGVVLHPTIDALIALGSKVTDKADVRSIRLRVHPHAVSITGVTDPKSGLKSKFSLSHSAAVAFLDGDGGIAQFNDARARDPEVTALRDMVVIATDDGMRKDQAWAQVVLGSGASIEHAVEHATGTVDNPMSDEALERKYLANAEPVIGARAKALGAMVWNLDALADARELLPLTAGDGAQP